MSFKPLMKLLLGALFVISLSACRDTPQNAKLQITISDWSSWNANNIPNETEETYTVSVDDSIELGGICNLTVTVSSISDKEIILQTNTPMSDKVDGTVDLNTDKTEFSIHIGESLKLTTPTMDEGNIYSFEIISIKQ